MPRFSLFKQVKHQSFDYKPRFYDAEKEELKQRMKRYDHLANPENQDIGASKDRIKSGLRSRQSFQADYSVRRRAVIKSNLRLLFFVIIISLLCYLFLSSDLLDSTLKILLK